MHCQRSVQIAHRSTQPWCPGTHTPQFNKCLKAGIRSQRKQAQSLKGDAALISRKISWLRIHSIPVVCLDICIEGLVTPEVPIQRLVSFCHRICSSWVQAQQNYLYSCISVHLRPKYLALCFYTCLVSRFCTCRISGWFRRRESRLQTHRS